MKTPTEQHLINLRDNLPWSKLVARLRPIDLDFIEAFLAETENDDPNERQLKINRIYIDQHGNKTRNWREILEILQTINSREYRATYPYLF